MHLPELAPTKDILDAYKKHKGDWTTYENKFIDLMAERRIEDRISEEVLDQGCLLCSEHEPHYCHRRRVVEYLQKKWNRELEVMHLV